MDNIKIRQPHHNEMFAIASQMLGASRIKVICSDGMSRVARIPGRMKDFKIRTDDLILIRPWVVQEKEKCDITYRYTRTNVMNLRRMGLYPEELEI